MASLEGLTVESFAPHVGERFTVEAGEDVRLEVELVEAAPAGAGGPGSRAPFALVFRGPADPVLEQRTYPMEHAALERLELFLVPIGRDEDGTRYEAVFA